MAASDFTYKWLVWDGRYSLMGDCNYFSADAPHVVARAATAPSPPDSLGAVLHVGVAQTPKAVSQTIVAATAVSVRLLKIVEVPGGPVAMKVQLKRLKKSDGSWNIKSLMLRIYRNYDAGSDGTSLPVEKLVYQEVLRKDALDLLADAQKNTDSGIPEVEEKEHLSGLDIASVAKRSTLSHSPYKIRVWVSTKKNAFGKAGDIYRPYTGEPAASYTVQVHDQYHPTEAEFFKKFELKAGDDTWEAFMDRRKTKEKAGKYEDKPGKNITQLSYKTLLSPVAERSIVQTTLERAAASGVPFTEALRHMAVSVAEPVTSEGG